MQPGTGLVGQQVQGIALGKRSSEPLCWFDPRWVGWAVVVVEGPDRLADQLDAPGWCIQGMPRRIISELSKQGWLWGRNRCRKLVHIARPEFVKGRRRKAPF